MIGDIQRVKSSFLTVVAICTLTGLLFGVYGGWWIQSLRIEKLESDHKLAIEKIKSEGNQQTAKATAIEGEDSRNLERNNAQLKDQISSLTATNKRLLNARSSAGYVPKSTASTGSANLACFDRTELNAALQRLDERISTILGEGDTFSARLVMSQTWYRDSDRARTSFYNPASVQP